MQGERRAQVVSPQGDRRRAAASSSDGREPIEGKQVTFDDPRHGGAAGVQLSHRAQRAPDSPGRPAGRDWERWNTRSPASR